MECGCHLANFLFLETSNHLDLLLLIYVIAENDNNTYSIKGVYHVLIQYPLEEPLHLHDLILNNKAVFF